MADTHVHPRRYPAPAHEPRKEIDADRLPAEHLIADIGQKTIEAYKKEIARAQTVFVNGPPGIFEDAETENGTRELWRQVAASPAYSVIGGGDSIAAVNTYGLADGFSYICTGGGAMVRFLSGDELPVVRALKKAALKFKR